MRYLSDDGKVFNTEKECHEYERQVEEAMVRREQLEMDRLNRLDSINKKYEELESLIAAYKKDYGVKTDGVCFIV